MADIAIGAAGAIPPAEVKDVELYHPKSWLTKYVFCQDAKVIAIQYSITALSIGLVALVLSWLMRLQLAFPSAFSFIGPGEYLQFITMGPGQENGWEICSIAPSFRLAVAVRSWERIRFYKLAVQMPGRMGEHG